MPTATQRANRQRLSFSSGMTEDLLPALRLMFGEESSGVSWRIDNKGYHLTRPSSAHMFATDAPWEVNSAGQLPVAAEAIVAWLEGLTGEDRRAMLAGFLPMEQAYMADPGIDVFGFRIATSRTLGGEHFMLTIAPAWV